MELFSGDFSIFHSFDMDVFTVVILGVTFVISQYVIVQIFKEFGYRSIGYLCSFFLFVEVCMNMGLIIRNIFGI